MKKIFSVSAVTVCLLLAACSKSNNNANAAPTGSGPSGPVELKQKWAVGKRFVYEMSFSQNSDMTIEGSPQPMQQQMLMVQDYSLSSLMARPEGGNELELKFISEKISSKMAGREMMAFDSTADAAKDTNNPAAPMLRRIVGAHIKFLTDPTGKIDKVEGYKEFMDQLTAGSAPGMAAMFQGMFTEETLKQFGSSAEGLPIQPVKIGDTWQVNKDMTAGPLGKMSIKMKFKFAGWEQHAGKNCALLTYTGDILAQGASSGSGSPTIDDGKLQGKVWFDPAQGLMLESTSDQSMTVKMAVQGKKMNAATKQNIITKLVNVENIATK